MKKVLLVITSVGIVLSGIAQNKYAITNMHTLPAKKTTSIMDAGQSVPMLPLKKPSMAHNKAVNNILIGTSANAYTYISEDCQWMDASQDIHAIMKTHRGGGAWGGSSSDIRCKISYDFGATWVDSVVFPYSTNLRRYPSGVIYNPAGNTDHANAFALICGPITAGSGWTNNYFESQQLNATNYVPNTIPIVNQELERINLCGGSGKYHVLSLALTADGNWYSNGWVRNMTFNPTTNGFDVDANRSILNRPWKLRTFSNATIPWNAQWNITFDGTGTHGYAYCMGADSIFDPYVETSTPLVWETFDAGATWLTRTASGCWNTLGNLTDQIWPTLASLTGGGDLVYRPFFDGGAQGDEGMNPGVIDYQGNLHIFCVVQGMYSDHADSLGYTFANHPKLMFDAYTTGDDQATGAKTWDVQFIDTIRTLPIIGVVDSTPFTNGSDTYIGWEHMMRISTSPDRKVIFFVWTDTDPSMSIHNDLPELKARAWNLETNMATPVINFTPGEGGVYYFLGVPKQLLVDGNGDYVIPVSYEDIFITSNPDVAQEHYFAEGIRISPNQFTETFSASTITGQCILGVENNVMSNTFAVSQNNPNPAKSTTEITVTLKENANVNVVVTNLMGQRVMEINQNGLTLGKNVITLNTSKLSSGVYFYTVIANNHAVTKKMMIE